MYSTFQLSSAQELNNELFDSMKQLYGSKPITITIEDNDDDVLLTPEMRLVLDSRLLEDETTYLTAAQSIEQLKTKYEL
jgi:hypothetical protein